MKIVLLLLVSFMAIFLGYFLGGKILDPIRERRYKYQQDNAKELKAYDKYYHIRGTHLFWTVPLVIIILAIAFCLKDILG